MRFERRIFTPLLECVFLISVFATAQELQKTHVSYNDGIIKLDAKNGFRGLQFGKPLPVSGGFLLKRTCQDGERFYIKSSEDVVVAGSVAKKIQYITKNNALVSVEIEFLDADPATFGAVINKVEKIYGEGKSPRSQIQPNSKCITISWEGKKMELEVSLVIMPDIGKTNRNASNKSTLGMYISTRDFAIQSNQIAEKAWESVIVKIEGNDPNL